MTTLSERLAELSGKATEGDWRITGVMAGHKADIFVPTAKMITDCDHVARLFAPKPERSPACSLVAMQMTREAIAIIEANAALIVELVNAYRAGRLIVKDAP